MIDSVIRQLGADEWPLFRQMRLTALQSDERYFTDSHADAEAWPDEKWQGLMENAAIFVAFDGGAPVGLGAISCEGEDTAELWAAFVLPAYRKRGLQTRLLEARIAWARAQPGVRRVTVAHREDNPISRQAILRAGFVHTHTKPAVPHGDGTAPA
jgi:RimJ/RimL family protein N-acetyltransferase